MKARVRDSNSYGGIPAGYIVEVDEGELARVPECLERLSNEDQAAIAVEPAVERPQIHSPDVRIVMTARNFALAAARAAAARVASASDGPAQPQGANK